MLIIYASNNGMYIKRDNVRIKRIVLDLSNALYINQLKMTEVSVETCLIILKALSFSLKF